MKRYQITVNGKSYDVQVEELAPGVPVSTPAPAAAPAAPAPAPVSAPAPSAAPAAGTQIKAPMPGNILEVRVAPGAQVAAGDVLLILEAMKMENEILAPAAGTVKEMRVKKGDTVNSDDLLAVIG